MALFYLCISFICLLVKFIRNIQFLLLILILQPFNVKSQTTPRLTAVSAQKKFDHYISMIDINGRLVQNIIINVEGSPYFIDSFRYADILLSDDKVFENIKVKIDFYKHEAHLIASDEKEIIADQGLIKEMILSDSVNGKWVFYHFKTGFPLIDKNKGNQFYQLLSYGEIQLLKLIKKEIVQTQNMMTREVKNEFVQYDEYYIFRHGEIKKLKKDKEFVLDLLKNEHKKIEDYLKDKKMNFRNITMLTSLFNYYNSLPR